MTVSSLIKHICCAVILGRSQFVRSGVLGEGLLAQSPELVPGIVSPGSAFNRVAYESQRGHKDAGTSQIKIYIYI